MYKWFSTKEKNTRWKELGETSIHTGTLTQTSYLTLISSHMVKVRTGIFDGHVRGPKEKELDDRITSSETPVFFYTFLRP